ncbi:type II toxin-antitoxin system RelE/ParE family toxin [bacterium]|nr:MAG: type II toxin-antitoxin system RelE/ParE family toxin [bacterium]
MAYKVVIQPQAESNIAEAFSHIAVYSPRSAQRWFIQVKNAIQSLDEMPKRCPIAPEARDLDFELRHLLHRHFPSVYRIVFRIFEEAGEVHILAVRHGAREPFSEEEMKPFLKL